MKICYDPTTGALLRLLRDDRDETAHGVPAGTSVLEFDALTNSEAVAKLRGEGARWQDLRVVGGILQHDGVPVALAADDPETTRLKQAKQALAALRGGTATNAQVQRVLAVLLADYIRRES